MNIAIVENLSLVKFSVAHTRGIASHPADTAGPIGTCNDVGKVIGMSAVDHEVGSRRVRRGIDGLDGLAEWFAGRERPVGLDSERDDNRKPDRPGCADDTDRRVKRIYLTSKGTQMIVEMRSRSHDMSERILDGLDTKSRHALVDMLALVKRNLLAIKGELQAD